MELPEIYIICLQVEETSLQLGQHVAAQFFVRRQHPVAAMDAYFGGEYYAVSTPAQCSAQYGFAVPIGARRIDQVDTGVERNVNQANSGILCRTAKVAGRLDTIVQAQFDSAQGQRRDREIGSSQGSVAHVRHCITRRKAVSMLLHS